MQAIYIQQHAAIADLKVSHVAKPSVNGKDEVLVKVDASGINPSDVASVQGKFPGSILPRIVGRDFVRTVVEGAAELIGTEVWGMGGDLGISRDGTHAEYVAIPRQAVSRRAEESLAGRSSSCRCSLRDRFFGHVPPWSIERRLQFRVQLCSAQ